MLMYQNSKLLGCNNYPDTTERRAQMLGNATYAKDKKTNILLIKESDLEGSSYEEFIDSGEERIGCSEDDEGGIMIKSAHEPTLESLLNNLTLDKPIFPNSTALSSSSYTTSAYNTSNQLRRNNSISWLSTAFRYEETSESNLVIDVGSTDTKPIILYASKMKLIEKLTTVLDYKLMDDFLLTVEMIIHPMDFASCLLSRLAQAFKVVPGWNPKEEIDPEVVKMRGLILLQHWASINTESTFDISIRRIVIETLDLIWQQSRTLSQSEQRFLIKIRRLYDPRGEISTTTPEEEGSDNELGNNDNDNGDVDVSSVFESETFKSDLSDAKKWREKFKLGLKLFFRSKNGNNNNSNNGSPQSSSSLLINSFSSDAECEDVSAFLMTERSRNLATILAVLEWDLFSAIQRAELVNFPAARESPHRLAEDCPNLQRAIEHFNSMCQWFVQVIANQDDCTNPLLAKLIRLACKCILIHNYNTALQIILALQSPTISSRKDLWHALPSWERRLARDLAVFGSPVKNFKNVRKALEQVQPEEIPVIPFNGLFLSDLVFNWERDTNKQIPQNMDGLIPFYKNHVAAKIIKQFVEFKQPKHQFVKVLSGKERQLYSYFADIGRLGGEFSI